MTQLSVGDNKKKARHRPPKSKVEGKNFIPMPSSDQDEQNDAGQDPIKRKRKSRAEIQVLFYQNFKNFFLLFPANFFYRFSKYNTLSMILIISIYFYYHIRDWLKNLQLPQNQMIYSPIRKSNGIVNS